MDDAALTVGEDRITLTRNEHRILQILLEHKGRIVSRDTLMLRLWESDSYTMWVHQIKTPIAAMGLLLQKFTAGSIALLKF